MIETEDWVVGALSIHDLLHSDAPGGRLRIHPSLRISLPENFPWHPGPMRGQDALLGFRGALTSMSESYSITSEAHLSLSGEGINHLVVKSRERAQRNGSALDWQSLWIWTLRDGAACELQVIYSMTPDTMLDFWCA